jgi:RimJ/RimL family protein N-acetyltransferase
MRRLHPDKFETINFPVEDRPENCSTKFLLHRSSSMITVDNPLDPKLLVVTYPSLFPSMNFFYGKADRLSFIQHVLKDLKQPTDLVIPDSFLPLINNYWPVQFSIPVLFLSAQKEDWRPEPTNDPRVRPLTPLDAPKLGEAFYNDPWLWEFFFSPECLLDEGQAVAAFIDGEIACVATTLAFTERYCELGVVTLPEYRGRGLGLECCRTLSRIQYERYGRLPCWRTDFENYASRKIAMQLGLHELKIAENYIFLSNYQHIGAYATVAP